MNDDVFPFWSVPSDQIRESVINPQLKSSITSWSFEIELKLVYGEHHRYMVSTGWIHGQPSVLLLEYSLYLENRSSDFKTDYSFSSIIIS